MAMDTSKFEAIKNKARKMIHEDAKQDSHIIKERQLDRERTYRSLKGSAAPVMTGFENIAPSYGANGTSIGSINENYSDDNSEERLYAAIDNYRGNRQVQQAAVPTTQVPTQVNKGLPKEILESFSSNYIDQSVFDPNRSVLDKLGIEGGNTAQPIQESVSQPNYQPSNAKVDYELIKSIVEASVKKYVNALSKKMLTENNDLGMIQVGDKKINLITKNGNVFEAELKFVKNINKK
jgi:hypothetical protein